MTKEFSDLVGCRVPVQLAAMPGVGTTELIAAVADAGGVGMLGAPLLSAEVLAGVLDDLQARTRGVVGVNFLVPFLDRGTLVVAAQRARVVEFFYGDPDADLVRAAAAHGARVGWQIGSRAEAEAAEAVQLSRGRFPGGEGRRQEPGVRSSGDRRHPRFLRRSLNR
jgi:NAD(P)H-dependent flavin oxidoreductase YrpB (nitropropane dioxygenase family)